MASPQPSVPCRPSAHPRGEQLGCGARGRDSPARKVEEEIVQKTTGEDPAPEESTHWTSRLMGKALGIDHVTIWRVWRKYGLKPHQIRRFKLSRDPRLVEKLHDVVGVYMNPPDNAVVFSFDEKSQIQALDRTQPSLPLKKGRAGTMTHDYKRHGTTTLFAALNVATGHVIHECMPRHRHQEFLKFIKTVERSVDPDLEIHVILDNYATIGIGEDRRSRSFPSHTTRHAGPHLAVR